MENNHMDKQEITERCKRVLAEDRCKHGMIYEYCGHCQRVEVPREYKFPVECHNDETGEDYTAWIGGVTTDVHYHTYRERKGNMHKRRTTKPRFLGYKVRTVDSAITKVRF
jgi:hypothetical protein